MNPQLAKKLIEKGAIRQGTTLEAYYHAFGLSGQFNSRILEKFSIQGATIHTDGTVYFHVKGGTLSETHKIACTEVVALDGMDALRIAKTYNFSLHGEDTTSGRRRGRKPRAVS